MPAMTIASTLNSMKMAKLCVTRHMNVVRAKAGNMSFSDMIMAIARELEYAANKLAEIVFKINLSVTDQGIHECAEQLKNFVINMVTYMASEMTGVALERLDIISKSVEQECEQRVWSRLATGIMNPKPKYCPFCNEKVINITNTVLRSVASMLSSYTKIPTTLLINFARQYVRLRNSVIQSTMSYYAYSVYAKTGNYPPESNNPPHPLELANEYYKDTISTFSELVESLNDVVEKYGGGWYKPIPGPDTSDYIEGWEIDSISSDVISDLAGDIVEPLNDILDNYYSNIFGG